MYQKETAPGERRVALVPEGVGKLTAAGIEVHVERGAGERAFFTEAAYAEAGARIVADTGSLYSRTEVLLKVQAPLAEEMPMVARGTALIGMLQPLAYPAVAQALALGGVLSFSLDTVPRIARAQAMDALTSMSSLAGYKGVLLAARTLPRFFPLMMTAAGDDAAGQRAGAGGGGGRAPVHRDGTQAGCGDGGV